MYNSRDDKSFTRARNYRPAWRYRAFSAAISRETAEKKWIITEAADKLRFSSTTTGAVGLSPDQSGIISGRSDLLENY